MADYVRANLLRRFFTMGWVTSLVGTLALIVEWISLYFIRNSTVEVNAGRGLGFWSDPWRYAHEPPMRFVFSVTYFIIFAGIALIIATILTGILPARFRRRKETKQ